VVMRALQHNFFKQVVQVWHHAGLIVRSDTYRATARCPSAKWSRSLVSSAEYKRIRQDYIIYASHLVTARAMRRRAGGRHRIWRSYCVTPSLG
jgi:hypothetical protein